MAKATVANNLVGKTVFITMGRDDSIETLKRSRDPNSNWIEWRLLGQACTVMAVFQNKNSELMLLVDTMCNAGLVEVTAKFCRVALSERN